MEPPSSRDAPAVAGKASEFGDRAAAGSDAGSAAEANRKRLSATHPSVTSKNMPLVSRDKGSGFDTTTIAAAAVGLVLLVGGVLVMRRRRAAAASGEEGDGTGPPATSDNPFSGLASQDGSQPTLPISEDDGDSTEVDFGTIDDDDKPVEPVHTRGRPKAEAASDTVSQGMGNAAAGEVGEQAASEEVMTMLREFEQRLESVETRLDEAVDTKERLERQVAAQTEELRVQRAAIARTQRAVRNLSRPEENGPTEPALREP
jgi:LPXTG-motif cell wall-anchored protein